MNGAPKEVLEEISRNYEQSLEIPNIKPKPQWMLMPVGLIGSGKTTVAKLLSSRLSLLRISTDEVRKVLKERGYSYEGARDITHGISKKYLNLGYSIAIDANTGSKAGIGYNKKTAEVFPDVRQIFIHINPPEEFILNKLKNYNHTWLFADAEKAIMALNKGKEAFTLPDLPFVYEFDTSRDDLPKQIDEAVIAIQKALET